MSKTIEDFGKALHLMRADIDHLRNVLVAVQSMNGPMLKELGVVRNSELADMRFFLERLLSTGFLDWHVARTLSKQELFSLEEVSYHMYM